MPSQVSPPSYIISTDMSALLPNMASILYMLLVVATIVVVVTDNRNPVKTLAWLLVLIFVPLAGLVLFFFFGRTNRKEKLISNRGLNRLMRRPMEDFQKQESLQPQVADDRKMKFFENINRALPFEGNEVRAMTNGTDFFISLLRDIYTADDHIHLEFFKFEDDPAGRLLRDALFDAAARGVRVRVIYDDVGCWQVRSSFFEEMLERGIEVRGFLKVRFPLFTSKVNYRNHRKIVVIDGKTGYTGGMNIAVRYLRGVDWGRWRDTMIRLKGRAVYGLQTVFLTDWYAMDRALYDSPEYFPSTGSPGNALVQIVTSSPIGDSRDYMQGLLLAITNAKDYFYIQTPYFLPADPIRLALKTIAMAGVDVRIMIPEKADTILTHYASCSFLDDMMSSGVNFYFYSEGFIHAKMVVSDDNFAVIGSTNIDFRSLEHNFEVNAVMYDKESALMCRDIFQRDMKSCRAADILQWKERPRTRKIAESLMRLLSPLL